MTRYQKAIAWRERHELTRAELAELTGYSRQTIYWFERGQSPPQRGKKKPGKIDDFVWYRFFMACAAVDAQLAGRKFDW